jgi:hypothetical protein
VQEQADPPQTPPHALQPDRGTNTVIVIYLVAFSLPVRSIIARERKSSLRHHPAISAAPALAHAMTTAPINFRIDAGH